ncbi:MAG TPA: hypothetical protein VFP17_04615, partial [Solirubrobacterales bacterium]|nr:hypothetical protein [Solirubrobacterales bacterium]
AAEQTERVGSYLKEKGPDEMLHDVEDFGRERPWAVLAGGLALGVVAARFLKASSRSRYQQRSGSNGSRPTAQVPRRTTPTPVNRSAVEPVVSPPPPTATPTPTATPVTPTPTASPAP